MHDFSAARIKKLVIHLVGNKGQEERLVLSENHVRTLAVEEEELLCQFFLKPFQTEDYHRFDHHSDLELNEAYTYVRDMFLSPVEFISLSQRLAQHLYEQSLHPRISGGEFYVVHFEDAVLDGEAVEAIGLFKSERKDYFMSVHPDTEKFDLSFDRGINVKKLDKGCMVFKTEQAEGFKVLTHDQLSRGEEAQYWKEDFLAVAPAATEYSMTKNYMSMCKSFVMEQMPREFEVDRTTQIDIMNRSSGYFTENKEIDTHDFAETVLEQPELVESFQTYKSDYTRDHQIEIEDHFESSKQAVRQGKKFFKSVLKLDKNFHIYVHGDRELIEHGYDEGRGMKFYKVFYNEEQS